MSDLMFFGILRMPPDYWNDQDQLSVMQRYEVYKEAADRLERMKDCRICGGLVDLKDAVRPSVKVGPGGAR
jgi:hypothetical protein